MNAVTARQYIIDQIFRLNFIDDEISGTALNLLQCEGVKSASEYLELVNYNQLREIHRGRLPGHNVLDGWVHIERRAIH